MTNIVITDKFYINYSIRNESEYDLTTNTHIASKTRLGFATYYEENVAFQKRKGTIDRWAGSPDTANTVDNVPRTGYAFAGSVTHGGNWNATTVNWRVVDPLGFELEINSGNMGQILQYCTIDKGTILDECVWGWDKDNGSKIVLIPVTSQIYQDAKKTSVRHFAEVIDVKDVQLGDMVEYKNGQMGLYFGRVNMITINSQISVETPMWKSESESIHVLIMDDNQMYFMKTPKIVACSKSTKRYTQEEAEVYLNECLNSDKWNVTGSGYGYYHGVFLTYDKKPFIKLKQHEIDYATVASGIRGDYKHGGYVYSTGTTMTDGNYILEDAKGDRFLIISQVHEVLGSGRRHAPTLDFYEGVSDDVELIVTPVANSDYLNDTNTGIVISPDPAFTPSSYYRGGSRHQELRVNRMLGEFVKFYKVTAHYKEMSTIMRR